MKLSEPEGDVTFDQIIVDFRERWGRAKRGGTRDVWAIVLARLRRDRIAIEAEARAAVLRELREEVADLSEWLSTCRCFVINPKFGEGQPGGHFTDCAWAQESDVRDEILAAIDRRLGG